MFSESVSSTKLRRISSDFANKKAREIFVHDKCFYVGEKEMVAVNQGLEMSVIQTLIKNNFKENKTNNIKRKSTWNKYRRYLDSELLLKDKDCQGIIQ